MTVSDTEEVTPALFDHAKRVYEEMLKRSAKEVLMTHDPEGELPAVSGDVYTGHLTRLFSDLQIANPYYTKIRNALVGQGCIDQVRRGGGIAMSKWVLNYPPEEEGFKAIMDRKRAPKGGAKIIEQRVNDLTRLTNDLVGQCEDLTEEILKLKARIKELTA